MRDVCTRRRRASTVRVTASSHGRPPLTAPRRATDLRTALPHLDDVSTCSSPTLLLVYTRACGFCKVAVRVFESVALESGAPFALINMDRTPVPAAVPHVPAVLLCDADGVRVLATRHLSRELFGNLTKLIQ